MTTHTVTSEPLPLVVHPENRVEEMIQNVRMILTTAKGTVPLDRDFGLDCSVLDQPSPRAVALLSVEIYSQIKRYEPRAKVVRVDFPGFSESAVDGTLRPVVTLAVRDEE
ncbi:MAG: GPW/gp25 family protein [Desulfobulbaceae bacterium]|jgi:phage baseplate assembly protein W|nr:GPW/gp25 family protein [Desulfobulbaceae bacterium]